MKILKHELYSIALRVELLISYIKYPTIKNRCVKYYAKAISQTDGKLLISNEVAKCANT